MKKGIVCLLLLFVVLCGLNAQSISQYEYWTDDDYASRSVVDAGASDISLSISTETLGAGIHFLNFRAKRDDGVWGNYHRYMYYIPTQTTSDPGSLSLEYWLDDNHAAHQSTDVADGAVSLVVDISQLETGVHFFNCTPISSTIGRGSSERYMFYVPIAHEESTVAEVSGYEYWFDDDYSAVVRKQATAGEQLLAMNIEGLASGVHYFNCRAVNDRGEYGCPIREMFYIPSTEIQSGAQLVSYEYWLDDDYAHHVSGNSSNVSQAFTIDISGLANGIHYFNYCAKDDNGRRGNVIREVFYIARATNVSSSERIEYEYWLDDDTSNKVTGVGTTGELVFNVDVSALDEGTHTFSFKAKDMLEQWGETFSDTFEITAEFLDIVTITAQNVSMTYGDEVPVLTYTVVGSALNGEPVLSTTATSTSPVGTYPIVVERGNVTNEHLNLIYGTLTIEKAPLLVTANDAEMTEGDDLPAFTFSYEGFKNGETESVLKTLPVATTSANSASAPGRYAIIASGATADNYIISYVDGTLTINVRPIEMGDIDGNRTIDMADVVLLINHIMCIDMSAEYISRMDMNNDGDINVADVVLLKKTVLNGGVNSRATARARAVMVEAYNLSEYTALQLDVMLPEGINMETVELMGDNRYTHYQEYLQIGERSYRIIVYSMTNQLFSPVDGKVLNLVLSHQNADVEIMNVLLVKPSGERVEPLSFQIPVTTGIQEVVTSDNFTIFDVYDMSGRKVRSSGESLRGLRKGVYMVNRKKTVIR